MDKKKIKNIASSIVGSMNMKEGQSLVVRSGIHIQELVEEIAIISMKKGIQVSIGSSTDNFSYRALNETPIKYLKQSSKLGLKMIEGVDNWISIEKMKDPRILEKIPHARFAASSEGGEELDKKMQRLKVKWCYVGYPTDAHAKKLGVKYKTLKKFIIDGMLVKKETLIEKSKLIAEGLRNAEYVHLTDEFGTDLKLKIKSRRINIDDGFISDSDIKHGDVGGNLPAGEVFIAPIETYGEGVLFSPKRTDTFTGKMIENIELVFKKGVLDMKNTKAEKNEKAMKKTITNSIKIDRKIYGKARAANVAELGIGLNPVIDKIIGYLLTDEKIRGTIHVALGANKMYGGKSESSMHWDFVSNDRINMEVFYPKGRSRMVIEKGKPVKK